jgi:hypothetical protein
MPKKGKEHQYLSLKTLFESGKVTHMKMIENLFPTLISKELGLNHSRYINKLKKPELFTMKQIMKLSAMIDVHPKIISDVIVAELMVKSKLKPKISK